MDPHTRQVRQNAVLLTGDERGVATEDTPRNIQHDTRDNTYTCSLNADWLEQLSMAEQSAPTVQSMSMGVQPVIIQQPCVVIQPADVLQGGEQW